jgi:hypothetical protein
MTSFAELDLAARTDKLEKAVDEIRKLGDQGERTEQRVKKSTNAMSVGFGKLAGVISGAVAGIASMQTVMASVTAARQFNAALAETSTLIDGIPSEMALISEGAGLCRASLAAMLRHRCKPIIKPYRRALVTRRRQPSC